MIKKQLIILKIFTNKISYSKNPYQAVNKVDALIIITEWNEFKQIDLNKVKTDEKSNDL